MERDTGMGEAMIGQAGGQGSALVSRRTSLAGLTAVAACLAAGPLLAGPAGAEATIWFNGDILTMQGDHPHQVEAVVETGGRIAFVGKLDAALRRFPGALRRDLAGQTLLPGFIDGHGHLYLTGFLSLMANIMPPPDGPAGDFDGLVQATRQWIDSDNGRMVAARFGWIVANGYDDAQLAERQHPTADVLDRISTEVPVIAIHQSGHLAAVNSKGLELAGITAQTPDPKGGVIRRRADGSPNGVLEEAAYGMVAYTILGMTDAAMQRASILGAQQQYARFGYTTAQEARASMDMVDALASAAQDRALYLDAIAYPDITSSAAAIAAPWFARTGVYHGHFRIGGAKLSLDGSPQGKTAWLSHAYLHPPEGQSPDYAGYGAMSNEAALDWTRMALRNRWPLLAHANGDAAIDQFIWAVGTAMATDGYRDHRTVLVHGQTLRHDQIAWLRRYGILPSLFPAHTFYWGDWHKASVLGSLRADYISPTREVLNAGLTLTSHHDAPVVPPNAMRVLDATVNRTTRSGAVLGPDQRLTPYEGLKALTEWAAIQCFEEGRKGTLEVGKLADFAILDANPLKIPPDRIHTIVVTETVKEGRTIHTAR